MPGPIAIGSFPEDDVDILLADLSGSRSGQPNPAGRATADPGATELLFPPEYLPSTAYISIVNELITSSANHMALLCAALAEQIVHRRGDKLVIVSIARAGTPVGILLKRWLRYRHALHVPHYSISVANGQYLDLAAVDWLCRRHDPADLQFVDAWTSKGTIRTVLRSARAALSAPRLDTTLAVLSDTGHCTNLFATRADVLIPHACLGATMSGLLSRTVADRQLTGGGGFHGVACYGEWAAQDLSNYYIDTIAARFAKVHDQVRRAVNSARIAPPPDERGPRHASVLARRYGADDLHLVNIGMSESARGFFRRLPLLLLVHPAAQHAVRHLLQIADERQVAVRREPGMPFKAALI